MTSLLEYSLKCYKLLCSKSLLFASYAIRIVLLASSFVTPFLFSSIIGYLSDKNQSLVFRSIVFIAIMYILAITCQAAIFFLELRIEKTSRISIKKKLLRHLLELHPSNSSLSHTARVTEIIYSDVNNVTTVTFTIFGVINDILTVLISGFIIFSLNPLLSVIIVLLLSVTMISSSKIAKILSVKNVEIRANTDANFKLARDININMKSIKISNAARYFSSLFDADIEEINRKIIRRDIVSWYSSVIGSIMENIGMVVFLIVGSYAVFNNRMSLPLFIMFSSYSVLFNSAITRLFKLNANMQQLITSIKRVFELYELKDERHEMLSVLDISDVRFKNVSFSYGDKNVISDFSYRFKKGYCYAIVGQNGSGKTTLLNLVSGILFPQFGEVLINDSNINDISYNSIQRCVSYFNQGDIVHDISIIDNLLLFDEGKKVPFDEVLSICSKLNILDDINKLPEKFNTILSEISSMSFGQKRKILLAKSFLKPSQVILLDEPLAGIDVASQEDIINAIKMIMKDKLVIVVTHRADLFDFVDNMLELTPYYS